jgi:hypothetical protein
MAETHPSGELVGWKAIAAYLRVSVRTAQDFEKLRALPIRRGSGVRAPVFALKNEREEWRQNRERLALQPPGNGESSSGSASDSSGDQDCLAPRDAGDSEQAKINFRARSSELMAGYGIHIASAGMLVAAMFATTVIMEFAYAYDRYRSVVWMATPLVLLWALTSTFAAAVVNWHFVRRYNPNGLPVALLVVISGAILNYLALRPLFPNVPITQASFQTWTAQAAYLKGIVYCTVFSSFFFLAPFNFVIAVRRELQRGMHNMVFEVLTRSKTAVAPRGAPFLPVSLFGAMLIGGAIYSLISTAHLLEALTLTRYTNLFILTIQIRWVLFLLLGVECCWWYYSALAQLKRECIVLTGLNGSEHKETRPKGWTEFET